jgi:hypothetical protein
MVDSLNDRHPYYFRIAHRTFWPCPEEHKSLEERKFGGAFDLMDDAEIA